MITPQRKTTAKDSYSETTKNKSMNIHKSGSFFFSAYHCWNSSSAAAVITYPRQTFTLPPP